MYANAKKGEIMAKYNGHKNWNHWNVALWLNNDEGLYNIALHFVNHYRKARVNGERHSTFVARQILTRLADEGITQTPDGAPYSVATIESAIRGM